MNETAAFLGTLYAGLPEGAWILIWTLPDKASHWCDSVEDAVRTVERVREHPGTTGVYFQICPSPQNFGPHQRCKAEHAIAIPGVWGDFDIKNPAAHKKGNLPPDAQSILDLLQAHGAYPTYVIDSGNGLQVFWLLPELMLLDTEEKREQASLLITRWTRSLQTLFRSRGWDVDSTLDLARVFRVPGTTNRKVANAHKPVRILEFTNRRWTPEELEARFIDDGNLYSAMPRRSNAVHDYSGEVVHVAGLSRELVIRCKALGIDPEKLHLDPAASIDADLIDGLKEQDPKFGLSLARQRKDLGDQSGSSYDLSIATLAACAGLKDQQIIDLLVYARRKHGDDPKTNNFQYYIRTLVRAREVSVKKAGIEQLEALGDGAEVPEELAEELQAESEEPLSEEQLRRKAVFKYLTDTLDIKITGLTKYVSAESTYILETAHGRINLGGVAGIAKQEAFRLKMLDLAGHQIPRFKAAEWDKISQRLRDACEEIDVGEDGTEEGQLRQWLDFYLEDNRPCRSEDAVKMRLPVMYDELDGQIMIQLDAFQVWLKNKYGEVQSRIALGRMLRMNGAIPYTLGVEIEGKKTTRSVWRLPRHVEDCL